MKSDTTERILLIVVFLLVALLLARRLVKGQDNVPNTQPPPPRQVQQPAKPTPTKPASKIAPSRVLPGFKQHITMHLHGPRSRSWTASLPTLKPLSR